MLEPHFKPSPEQPLPAAGLFVYARPLPLSRWNEKAFEVTVHVLSQAATEVSKTPRSGKARR
jgi:hypothetical protein